MSGFILLASDAVKERPKRGEKPWSRENEGTNANAELASSATPPDKTIFVVPHETGQAVIASETCFLLPSLPSARHTFSLVPSPQLNLHKMRINFGINKQGK